MQRIVHETGDEYLIDVHEIRMCAFSPKTAEDEASIILWWMGCETSSSWYGKFAEDLHNKIVQAHVHV